MYYENIIKNMSKPHFYGKNINSVKKIETHISYVFLTGKFAYKIKKPVDYGFLDFSTLDKRKYYCYEELKLNRRLCPDIYIEVLPITKRGKEIELNGNGEVIDYTLLMKEFSQKNIMKNLLEKGKIRYDEIDKINEILINFYNSIKTNDKINKYGKIKNIKKNLIENFTQTKKYINLSITEEKYNYIKNIVDHYLTKKEKIFNQRITNKNIHDCHGDLHTGNIVISKMDIYIFDCIEFNKRFRYCDSASDIGFLAMDLDYQNHPYHSSYLIESYIKKSNDFHILEVLNFYKSYRAYVRGKVISFNLNGSLESKKYTMLLEQAKKYFELSNYYSSLLEIEIRKKKPLLFIIFGLTGTGKSTLSLKLSIDYNAKLINTDIIRKKIAGINLYEKHHDEFNTGLYSPEKLLSNYMDVMKKVKKYLNMNKNVIIDATFQKNEYRLMINKIAKKYEIRPIYVQCICPEIIIKKWLDDRLRTKTVSDGRWEIYKSQKKIFEPVPIKENIVKIDMSKNTFEKRMKNFNDILSITKGVIL
jgi:aminoglycoside phosphotransferase family enzyme/predicted kinase